MTTRCSFCGRKPETHLVDLNGVQVCMSCAYEKDLWDTINEEIKREIGWI